MPALVSPRACRLAAVAVLAVAVAAGCGSKGVKKITVTGTVSYKGQKLSGGIVKFVGEGFYNVAVINPDGGYTMTDVVPGEVKIAVVDSPSGSGSSNPNEKQTAPRQSISLPDKFREPETSGVKYTIESDTKELHVELK